MCEGCAYYAKYILWNCQHYCAYSSDCEITKTGIITIIIITCWLAILIRNTRKEKKKEPNREIE